MTPVRGALLLLVSALGGGLLLGAVYGVSDGVLMAGFMLGFGAPAFAGSHALARRRAAAGSLARQLGAGVAITVGLATVGLIAIALLMFLSGHDALVMVVLLVFSGALTVYGASVLASGVMHDIEAVRDGLRAVGEGRRDLTVETAARDEIAELALAANRMTQQLSASEAEREAAEASRRDLIAAVSHDLRTPLTSLRLLSSALEDDMLDASDRDRYLAAVPGHVAALSALIDDLFELSRLEAGEISWSIQQVAMDELIAETVEAMRPQAEHGGVAVTCRVEDMAAAHADPEKVQRVLFNLIQNAIRHTPADGSITVCAECHGPRVEIEVSDTGAGLASADRARAFEPFFRGGADGARSGTGAGLGLAICRAIVEAHRGQIWFADSAEGVRVRFSLPRAA